MSFYWGSSRKSAGTHAAAPRSSRASTALARARSRTAAHQRRPRCVRRARPRLHVEEDMRSSQEDSNVRRGVGERGDRASLKQNARAAVALPRRPDAPPQKKQRRPAPPVAEDAPHDGVQAARSVTGALHAVRVGLLVTQRLQVVERSAPSAARAALRGQLRHGRAKSLPGPDVCESLPVFLRGPLRARGSPAGACDRQGACRRRWAATRARVRLALARVAEPATESRRDRAPSAGAAWGRSSSG